MNIATKVLFQRVAATFLPLFVIVSMALLLENEACYESWERSLTQSCEVSWMQEPILHKLKRFLSGRQQQVPT